MAEGDGGGPLLVLGAARVEGAPAAPTPRGGPPLPKKPRQVVRLTPRFEQLQKALERREAALVTSAGGVAQEQVVVFEAAVSVAAFVEAVDTAEGLEWLLDQEIRDLPPDADFFDPKRPWKPMSGRLYMVVANQVALRQLLSLWKRWVDGKTIPKNQRGLRDIFPKLRDIRAWGPEDRLRDEQRLRDLIDPLLPGETIPVEIELWYRRTSDARAAAQSRVLDAVKQCGGSIVSRSTIEGAHYHAVLARLRRDTVAQLLDHRDVDLILLDDIFLLRAMPQVAVTSADEVEAADGLGAAESPTREAVVALFDGLPIENHPAYAGSIVVDDPDGWSEGYLVEHRLHGTQMASLIVRGENLEGPPAGGRPLYVRPILRPSPRAQNGENAPEDELWLDLIHRAVRRLVVGDGGEAPVAPSVRIINLSIGDRGRPFAQEMSPLARLIDWLAWEYDLLFLVSAGNQYPQVELADPDGADAKHAVFKRLVEQHRLLRLLSPAESLNALTVGALADDDSTLPPHGRDVVASPHLPALYSALGRGFRRAVKPDFLAPGGRQLYRPAVAGSGWEPIFDSRPPGHRVAVPRAGGGVGTAFTRGTSAATALTSRWAGALVDVVADLRKRDETRALGDVPDSVIVKALLVHTAEWRPMMTEILAPALKNDHNAHLLRDELCGYVGFGALRPGRAFVCEAHRATMVGGGVIQQGKCHIHRIPLPDGVHGHTDWRRLTITLAWFSPTNPGDRRYRKADLSFNPPADKASPLRVNRVHADWQAAKRGTVQHEVLEDPRRVINLADQTTLEIPVMCREDAPRLDEAIPYALVVSLEVGEEVGIPIYQQVRDALRVRPRVRVR